MFGYILDGELTVDYGKHGTRTYRQGQALMEAMDVAHFGINSSSQPVRIGRCPTVPLNYWFQDLLVRRPVGHRTRR